MDIELDQTFVAHLQKEGLASFRIRDIGAPHDLVDCERLLGIRPPRTALPNEARY